ncbi:MULTISPECIES: AraC family transcriptional regulator [Halomonadaceae]|jgi:AraC-like DNA-binding protein|uniref:HTH-type transcriptional activator RhaS n=1 Tax=Vreelandella titanicae TaxID=664683 RepID=A0A654B3Q7_9GAMM|nr:MULTISPECIES: AraC family transcriptional regulator [Halomonas]QKS27215.1 HTH-type transcriptional activator RhaS [Halomonas titanicae]TMU27092.1 AraC family transcriptional regulator [Halomonas sp. ATBC28]CAD5275786.1 Transcriptional regulator, AraC family [Halomonas sp. 156]CAD5276162.1 Transcriptional regulator, AraC family [Halomonas sp. 113]CAD5277645.1 Transcriptional regulator, AraC family [Halomonas sp. 59]|tara:strand:- start:1927 stop:2859 length:933 start_codon:yes stop_codon:yes gene_type:complete
MNSLKQAVQTYAKRHANSDGLALTSVPGLRMMCVEAPAGDLQSVYKPLVCLVLQGAKRILVGKQQAVLSAGESVIVSADMPVVGRIVQASTEEPYLAVAVELDRAILRELAAHIGSAHAQQLPEIPTLFAEDSEVEVIDCVSRLMKLLDRPDSAPLLRPGIMQELHYWLLSGPQGAALRDIADPDSYASHLADAIALLRAEYTSRVSVEQLAAKAGMSLSSFHKHFKHMTSLTPGQYQQRLRLIEARRLMLDEGCSASNAAFEVGYESVSQFTREYGRLFQTPPKRDALRYQKSLQAVNGDVPEAQRIGA